MYIYRAAFCTEDEHLSSVKFPEFQFHCYCSGNLGMSALLEHPIDIMVYQSSHVKIRFSFDLNFIFEILFSMNSAGIFNLLLLFTKCVKCALPNEANY